MQAIGLLCAYSIGMALPFMCLSVGINFLLGFIRRTKMVMRFINPVAGILLVLIGLALVTDSLKLLTL
jgi:cytochrome c-type biogenesis protein